MLAEREDVAAQLDDDGAAVVGPAVLQHVLDHVVAVLVLDEPLRVLVQLVEHRRRLRRSAVLQDALDHAAAVRVRRQRKHLTTEMTAG